MKPHAFELNPDNYPFSIELATRFADLDTLRHVNNVAIAELFEESRVRFGIFSRDMTFTDMPAPGRLVNVSVLINYLGEVFYPDTVTVAVGVCHIGTSSHTLSCLMLQQGKPVAHSRSTLVRSDGGKSQPLPADVVAMLDQHRLRTA